MYCIVIIVWVHVETPEERASMLESSPLFFLSPHSHLDTHSSLLNGMLTMPSLKTTSVSDHCFVISNCTCLLFVALH